MNITKNKILITGGASGIGLALAERFVAENNTVIICGRREDALQLAKTKLPSIISRQCDLTIPEQREELFDWIKNEHNDLNVLINNAGIQNWMSVDDENFNERAQQEININVQAPVHLTSLFLNLKSLNTIMNVTSGLAFVPLLKTPVYCATKAFLHSYTLSLRELLNSKNIEVIEIIPPALNTDLGGKGIHDFAPPVSDFIESIFAQLKDGKISLTFGFTDAMNKSSQEMITPVFHKMNQIA